MNRCVAESRSNPVTVFVLLLLVGVVGTQSPVSLSDMAFGQIQQDRDAAASRRPDAERILLVPRPVIAEARWLSRRVALPRSVAGVWWPAPRGPDAPRLP